MDLRDASASKNGRVLGTGGWDMTFKEKKYGPFHWYCSLIYSSTIMANQPPTFSIWIVTFSSSFLARPACAIFFWCGLPARWDSKVFKKARSKMWQQKKWTSYLLTGNCKLAHLTLDWNCLEWKIWAPQWHSACILLFSFSSSSTFVVAPWLFKRHTWVVWSFR